MGADQHLMRWIRNFLKQEYKRIFRHADWNIGVAREPIQAFLKSDAIPDIDWLPHPRLGKYLADPFAVERDGKLTVLCEEFDYHSRTGLISCIEIPEAGPPTSPQVVMDFPIHVSYPYLIQHKEEIFCVPETARAREVGLYRAEEFPHEWAKVATLLEGFAGVDPTVFQHGGRWWLACTDDENGPVDKLRLWHARDLYGPWEPHEINPVKTDIHTARPAGTPFVYRGDLYRPAQDCAQTYGGRIVLNKVLRLTPAEFEEIPAVTLQPYAKSPYPDGLHTISSAGAVTLVDSKRMVLIRSAIKQSLKETILERWADAIRGHWIPRLRKLAESTESIEGEEEHGTGGLKRAG